MKIINRIIFHLFSFIVLFISAMGLMTLLRVVNLSSEYFAIAEIVKNPINQKIGIAVFIVLIMLSLKGLFFFGKEDEFDDGIELENDDGRLIITKHTLKNIIDQTVKSFDNIEDNYTKIYIDENSDISVLETIYVTNDTIIKEVSNSIQIKVKEAVKKSLDVELKVIDIRVRDVVKKKASRQERK